MTMSENNTENVRKGIMMTFLRTLVWIDDEIRPDKADSDGDPFRSFFYPTAQEFQKKELLVHLHPYDPDTSSDEDNTFDEDSESLGSAVSLAKKADVIILDWHLGREDPQHSIQLLKSLENESAIRYIIVLSKFADRFEEEMKTGEMLMDDSDSPNDTHLFQNIGDAWANNQGTHIIVMKKPDLGPDFAENFCRSVIDAIYALMSKANPDYLHWAAIEIAAKLRHSIPGWVQAIPRGTDTAVLSELISEDTEARSFIPEHLLEDLSHLAKLHSLASLDSKNCNPEDWRNRPHAGVSDSYESKTQLHNGFVRLSSSILEISEDDIKKMRETPAIGNCTEFIKCQETLAQFCESISRHVDSNPAFGAVYEQLKKVSDGEKPKIYVCVSQECDCLRGYNLLFLEGKESAPGSSDLGSTKLLFQGREYKFAPRAEGLKPFKVDSARSIKELRKIGQLRDATARRILSRFWNHFSRSAINLPTFARIERAEK